MTGVSKNLKIQELPMYCREVSNLLWKLQKVPCHGSSGNFPIKMKKKITIQFIEKYLGNLGSSQLTLEVQGFGSSRNFQIENKIKYKFNSL